MITAFSSRKGVILLTYSRGSTYVTGLGPSRSLHKTSGRPLNQPLEFAKFNGHCAYAVSCDI